MSFEPGGDVNIPNQIGSSAQRRGGNRPQPGTPQAFTKALIRMAVINAVLLSTAMVIVYVLELIDPSTGVWLVVAAALVGGVLIAGTVMKQQRDRARYAQSVEAAMQAGSPASMSQQPLHSSGHGTHQGTPHVQSAVPGNGGTFRFEVENAFTITGRGTVVAGRVTAGDVASGQTVTITREGRTVGQATVAEVEVTRRMVGAARAGDSAGLLLPGVDRSDLRPGDVIVPG